ncbi:hypothetical protein NDU88_005511 [Pleurodeles waltl]|uniref:Uncharacterized protein n=1 Tax=Pleurodeles waltl TaxID=8319 RepID=A0AAV7TU75_PLEWA|nr:hypothetical protein NDU88_005511 [Pleurodeles waltl]
MASRARRILAVTERVALYGDNVQRMPTYHHHRGTLLNTADRAQSLSTKDPCLQTPRNRGSCSKTIIPHCQTADNQQSSTRSSRCCILMVEWKRSLARILCTQGLLRSLDRCTWTLARPSQIWIMCHSPINIKGKVLPLR